MTRDKSIKGDLSRIGAEKETCKIRIAFWKEVFHLQMRLGQTRQQLHQKHWKEDQLVS